MITIKFKTKISIFFALLIFFVPAIFISCTKSEADLYRERDGRVILKRWNYSLDGKNFRHLPSDDIDSLAQYTPGSQGYIYIQSFFSYPDFADYETDELALNMGKILVAGEIYLNGRLMDTIGQMPPRQFYAGNASTLIKLPREFLKEKTPNEIVCKIYVEGRGGITGIPCIGLEKDIRGITAFQTFFMSRINIMFSLVMFVCSMCYLILYFSLKRDKEYLYYALMNLFTTFYLFPFCISELPWIMGRMNLFWFNKIFVGVIALYTSYYASSFIHNFLRRPYERKMHLIRLIMFTVSNIVVLAIPNPVIFYKYLGPIFGLIGLQLVSAVIDLAKEWKTDRRHVLMLIFGFSPVIFCLGVDFILKGILKFRMVPYFTLYGWQFTIITFLIIVSGRYAKVRKRVEYLNSKLEAEVESRTKALTKANEELELKNYESERDMELAVHVQESFYMHDFDFPDWDIAVSFNPLSGVSGDLYDFYLIEGKLRGFGLFDVSGHGISSGLVTMLAKNAILSEFMKTLPLNLTDATRRINDAIIRVKGKIDNYLTGIIFRMDKDNPSKIEFTNAGNPYPLVKHKDSEEAELLLPDKRMPQYGMIGIEGMSVSFQNIPIVLEEGDSILIYTDGFSESENKDGEQYGNERIQKSFGAASGSSEEIIRCLMQDFNSFVEDAEIKDDITVIVLKRVHKEKLISSEIGELLEV